MAMAKQEELHKKTVKMQENRQTKKDIQTEAHTNRQEGRENQEPNEERVSIGSTQKWSQLKTRQDLPGKLTGESFFRGAQEEKKKSKTIRRKFRKRNTEERHPNKFVSARQTTRRLDKE